MLNKHSMLLFSRYFYIPIILYANEWNIHLWRYIFRQAKKGMHLDHQSLHYCKANKMSTTFKYEL